MPAYTQQAWADNDATKPVSAARMGVIETGIDHASVPTKSTALPGSPFDGQEIYYEASSSAGVYWHLRYRSASGSSFKWECLGGSDLYAIVETSETTSSSSYTNLGTVGPSITVPLAGDYEVEYFATLLSDVAGVVAHLSVALGATVADDAWNLENGSGRVVNVGTRRRFTGLAASDAIVMKYRIASGTLTAGRRILRVRPVRVG